MSVNPQTVYFEPPTVENDAHFARLPKNEQEAHLKYVHRANKVYEHAVRNGIPKQYTDYIAHLKDVWRENFSMVNYEALYALDSSFGMTIYDQDWYGQLPVPKQVMQFPRWQAKKYRVTDKGWGKITREFNTPTMQSLGKDDTWDEGFGLYMGIGCSWQKLRESQGGLWDILSILNQQAAAKFGLQKSEIGFRGYDILHQYWDNPQDHAPAAGWTGLLNDASIQAFTSGDLTNLDANVTGDNEVNNSIKTALTKFDKCYWPHDKYIISTRGVFAETILEAHRDTYAQKLDIYRIIEKYVNTGFIKGWLITDQILNAAATTSNQSMAIVGFGSNKFKDWLPWPLQRVQLNDKKTEQDYREMIIWGRIHQYDNIDTTNNAIPATIDDSMTTTTVGTDIPQGWVDLSKWSAKGATGIQV